MLNDKYISLVLPCQNEEKALAATLCSLSKEIDEIIVVDNNSTDQTPKIARSLGAKVFYEEQNKNGIGYGFALARGIKESKGDIIVCMDGDGSYPVEEVSKLIKQLDLKKLDFISCSRIPFKNPRSMSPIRTIGVKLLNLFIFLLFGYKIRDCLSGMWVFRRNAINSLNLSEGGWNFSLEIKLNALKSSEVKFSELNISYHDRVFDCSKQNLFRTGLEHSFFLLRKRFLPKFQKDVQFLLLTRKI